MISRNRVLWFIGIYLISLITYAVLAFVERGALRLLR
jgi:hypothetical protein